MHKKVRTANNTQLAIVWDRGAVLLVFLVLLESLGLNHSKRTKKDYIKEG